MPAVVPAQALRNAVALSTAARHLDCPGGRDKLLELTGAMTAVELSVAALVLARLVGASNTDEQLQALGSQCLDDGMILL